MIGAQKLGIGVRRNARLSAKGFSGRGKQPLLAGMSSGVVLSADAGTLSTAKLTYSSTLNHTRPVTIKTAFLS